MTEEFKGYKLIDSGDSKKLEQFGAFRLIRPSSAAIWPKSNPDLWEKADAEFFREGKETGDWKIFTKLPQSWTIYQDGLNYQIEPNKYGNVGLFPEHLGYQDWILNQLNGKRGRILNLFSYSGSNSLKLIQQEHFLTCVDSSKQSMQLLVKNLELNDINGKARLILDDVQKFLKREINRAQTYDAILLDPPTYGRGAKGEVFKIQDDLIRLLDLCRQVLVPRKNMVVLTCHTPGFNPNTLKNLMRSVFGAEIEAADIDLEDSSGKILNAGTYARFSKIK